MPLTALATVPSPTPNSLAILGRLSPCLTQFHGPLSIKDCFGTAKAFAILPGIAHPGADPLPYQLPLKLCHRRQDVKSSLLAGLLSSVSTPARWQ